MTPEELRLRRLPIEPWWPAHRLQMHDDAYLDRFVDAAMQVLERTGVKVLSERAVGVFRQHDAVYEPERQIIRLPESAVRGALASAPRTFTLASRDGSCDIDLASGATYMTADGCGTEVIDWRTGQRRASTKADLADATRLLDYVSSIGYWWPTISAGDCGETAQLHELDAAWNNTVKHLQGMVQGGREARYAVEMASVIAGGAQELRRHPPLSDLTFAVSPLTIDRDGADAALVFAEAGVPVVLGSAPSGGTTAPATAAGAMVQALAEVLALVALVQLAHPGAPVFGYPIPGIADPRTGGSGHSLDGREPALCVDLVHHLGLPSQHGAGGGTDTELSGTWTEAAEGGPSLTMAAWSGSELTVGLGLTNGGRLWSAEDLILDDHLYHQARYAVMDMAVDDEELALDVIDAVGPGGHFLGHAHTRKHMRESFVRGLTGEPDASGGNRDPVEVARERARDILEHYEPEPLDEAKAAALRRILVAADAELKPWRTARPAVAPRSSTGG
jgi:trimethylamine--corrinoid protein Co-methyltransferase